MISAKNLKKFKEINHGFFDNKGGHSKGIYKSLNCGIGSSDNKKDIKKNLKIVCKKLSSSHKKLVLLNQVHSNKFHFIEKKNKSFKRKLIGDALITNKKKIIIGILTADCVPILIYDKNRKMISAIHAGWKGAYKGVVKKVINFFLKTGSESKDLIAAIGPSISQNSYEIKRDFKNKFLDQNKKNETFFKKIKNKTYFGLNKYVYTQLKDLGIKKIDIIDKDTYNPKNNFFSARRSIHKKENDYGRNISIIMIN